jgi:hypothetical protein
MRMCGCPLVTAVARIDCCTSLLYGAAFARRCRRPYGRPPSRSAARRGEGHRVIHQNDARDPLLPRTRDARISGSPGAPPAREGSDSGLACVCTSPGRPAANTCRRSHRSSADNGRRWACALLHDSAAGVPRIRLHPFDSSTCRLAGASGLCVCWPLTRRRSSADPEGEVGVPVDELPVAVDATVDVGDPEGHVTQRAAVDADMAPLEAGRVGEVSAGGDDKGAPGPRHRRR